MRVVSIYRIAYILKTIGIIAKWSQFFKVIVFKFSGLKIENQFFDQKHIFRIPPHNWDKCWFIKYTLLLWLHFLEIARTFRGAETFSVFCILIFQPFAQRESVLSFRTLQYRVLLTFDEKAVDKFRDDIWNQQNVLLAY